MKFLVVGLGSMGKRRIRNLFALDHNDIAGFDPRIDRREEVKNKYNIKTYESFQDALAEFQPTVLIISTSPDLHMDYAIPASKMGLHCFIEASVIEEDRIEQLYKSLNNDIVISPSCTMRYHPLPVTIREILKNKYIGEPLSFNYITGQYLPDWHPWENINEFYVSNKDTGGAREIVPFELTWLNEIFGEPLPLGCVKDKLSDMDAEIDDIYLFMLRYPKNILANITVEVLSRPTATREIQIIGTHGKISYSSADKFVKYIKVGEKEWNKVNLDNGTIEPGYVNPEEPYINEMKDFLKAVSNKDRLMFPNSLEKDVKILRLLNTIEGLVID